MNQELPEHITELLKSCKSEDISQILSDYRRELAVELLRQGQVCKSCSEPAVWVYATGCHGNWFMCDKHNIDYQNKIQDVDEKQRLYTE